MNGTFVFPIAQGQTIKKGDFLAVNASGEVVTATPDNPNVVGIAVETRSYIGNGQDDQCLVSLHNLYSRGPISFYAPKNPIPYKNLEFEFDLKTGKPKTPVFELIFKGIARTFQEVQITSREYLWFDNDNYLYRPYKPDEPIVFHDNRAIANYQYNCTIAYDERYNLIHGRDQHYEILLCVIGKNTYIFQEAHIKDTHEIFQISRSRAIKKLTIYADKREFILYEEALQEKIDPRFNIELGECDRSLPSGKYDIEISSDYPYIA